MLLMGNCNS